MKLPVRLAHGCWLLFSDRMYSVCYTPIGSWRRIGREGSWLLGSYQWNGSTPHESAWVCGLEITRWNGGVDAYGNP